ncbi:uncharacterized protein N7484_011891 [Penicillium longicatenatum]|uniref:uncharacterized protein n=1 Tax=Penicillium longicatenatum TaxID=1561947 RepID=UPI002548081D|nr:uncharacterized protein N7484_011891 [Penicillium longicatenatum]KAJ5631791.1 hypothetical protein N7484_011891 [Penicillium longicatenatum]
MRFTLALSTLAMAISVGAITVTEPKEGADITSSSSLDVKWTYVNTDETSLDIYLVNQAVYPNVNKKLASDVSTSDGSYTVNVGNIPSGHGYQISLKSDEEHNTGILAQSNQFNVTESASKSTSSSSTESSTSSSTKTTTATSMDAVSTTTFTSTGSDTTMTGTSTMTASNGASTASGMMTSASSTANSTAAATATPSAGAGFAVAAHPAAAIGVVGGLMAFML